MRCHLCGYLTAGSPHWSAGAWCEGAVQPAESSDADDALQDAALAALERVASAPASAEGIRAILILRTDRDPDDEDDEE